MATVKALGIPGAVIGVTGGPAGNFERAFGYASIGHKMQLNDHFRIGSVTKTFTATVILELVDRHKLRLDQSIHKWEPRIQHARQITVRMVLNMTSGIWDEGGPGSLLSAWVGKHCFIHKPSPHCGKYWKPQEIGNLAIKQGPSMRRRLQQHRYRLRDPRDAHGSYGGIISTLGDLQIWARALGKGTLAATGPSTGVVGGYGLGLVNPAISWATTASMPRRATTPTSGISPSSMLRSSCC